MVVERDIRVASDRTVHVWDTGAPGGDETGRAFAAETLTVVWHHGSPQTGRLLEPVVSAAAARGIRVVSCTRAGYPGATALPGRSVAGASADVVAVAAALGLERYASVGASGGGPHALGCAALDPEHVVGAVTLAGIAPYSTDDDWFAGMASPQALTAALAGREARREHELSAQFDPDVFIEADYAALDGEWAPLGADANRATALATAGGGTPWGLIDDDVAYASPWGFDLADARCPVLVVQGGRDRMIPPSHAGRLVDQLPAGELWLRPRDGHVSVLEALPVALDWLLDVAGKNT